MKKIIGSLVCFAFFLVAVGSVYADPYSTRPHEWTDKQEFRKPVTFYDDVNIPVGGIDATEIADIEGRINLPLMSFTYNGAVLPSSMIQEDDGITNLVWPDGATTPVQITFPVPDDYASGGHFELLCTESDSTTPNEVDFDVYMNRDGIGIDSSGMNQTPVALAGTTSTPDVVTLTPTDFASLTLVAGDWVTQRMWRCNTATGTGDLEVKGSSFVYNRKQ